MNNLLMYLFIWKRPLKLHIQRQRTASNRRVIQSQAPVQLLCNSNFGKKHLFKTSTLDSILT